LTQLLFVATDLRVVLQTTARLKVRCAGAATQPSLCTRAEGKREKWDEKAHHRPDVLKMKQIGTDKDSASTSSYR